MAAPSVQIMINAGKMRLMWERDTTDTYRYFNLYWSLDSGMAGEAQVQANIPNVSDGYYSDRHVTYLFNRSDIGVGEGTEFYMRLKGVDAAGIEDAAHPGPTKYVRAVDAQREEYDATQIYGYDYTKQIWKRVKVQNDGTLA
jgi:hypothetical protein